MATAKNRAIDHLRATRFSTGKHAELERELQEEEQRVPDYETAARTTTSATTCCVWCSLRATPACRPRAQIALTLRLLGGLTTEEIARAFLVQETTIQQRIVRAKRTLAEVHAEFELPRGDDRAQRLSSVLTVLYLIFNEGYSATAGEDLMRPALCEDAQRLGRILAELAQDEPRSARARGPHGDPGVARPCARRRQRRAGVAARPGSVALGSVADPPRPGRAGPRRGNSAARRDRMRCRAALAACHARARTAEETDWVRIASLYDVLAELMRSPVVELNRAVAHAMAFGPAAGLALVDTLQNEPSLRAYICCQARGRTF